MKRTALAVAAALLLAPAASADHGHNCVYSGGGWMGQGLCPGMPGYTPHTDPPAPEPEPEPTATVTPAPPAPAPPAPAPVPPPAPPAPPATTPPPTPTQTPRPPGCLRSYGNTWCTGPGATSPAPGTVAVVTAVAPVAEPEPVEQVDPAEHWIWQYVY